MRKKHTHYILTIQGNHTVNFQSLIAHKYIYATTLQTLFKSEQGNFVLLLNLALKVSVKFPLMIV